MTNPFHATRHRHSDRHLAVTHLQQQGQTNYAGSFANQQSFAEELAEECSFGN